MKTTKIFLITALFLFLIAGQIQAAGLTPLVQCGITIDDPCEFCDLFETINRIIKFSMFDLLPLIAILMLTVGGVMFFFGGIKPDTLNQAKGIIFSVVAGFVIILGAWVAINTIITQIGIVQAPSILQWYNIGCQ